MPAARTELLIEIVGEAVQRPASQREAYVRAACADPADQREALSLLAALDAAGGFMNRPTVASGRESRVEARGGAGGGPMAALIERPGTSVGRYTLLEQIGEGGFGVVFSAEQREPVHRTVALKIIKPGMDTRAVIARFQAERQALAMMDHSCIAKVLDGGVTDTGRPYFVMELVRGAPITSYCKSHDLPIQERLALVVEVCRAVQHAHTKGIIHRDLKPANVLVTEVDGRPLPRVIDFGIAKATTDAGEPAFTEARQFIGTPEYMSPEQAQSPAVDVDTRTDVYSLGVLLYELLTGATPHDGGQLRSASWDQMLRIIREVDPPRPSTRALARPPAHGPPATSLRGDLDWIVMCCLEKDRARRYQTADGLAADLQRHLRGEPVLAAPPSRAYRVRKFIRRNRAGVAATTFAALSLVAGLGAALWQAAIAARERDQANARQRDTEQVADFQAAQLRGIDPRLMGARLRDDLLAAQPADPERAGADPARAQSDRAQLASLLQQLNLTDVALRSLDRNIFSRALAAIRERFADQPRVRAKLLLSVSDTMADLGLLDAAEAPMQEALGIYRAALGDDDPSTLRADALLSGLLLQRGKLSQAEPRILEHLDRCRRVLSVDDPVSIEALRLLASLRAAQSRTVESERLFREVLERNERVCGPGDVRTLQACLNIGVALMSQGKAPAAESFLRRAYEGLATARGADDRDTLKSLNNLAVSLRLQRKYAQAEPLFRESLHKLRLQAGDLHPDTLSAGLSLALLLRARATSADLAEADAILREVLEGRRQVLGKTHRDTLQALYVLGDLRMAQGRPEQAEPLFRESLTALEAVNAGASPTAFSIRLDLARALRISGRFPEAESILLQSSRALSAAHGGGAGPSAADPCARDLADLYAAWDQAEPGNGYDAKAAAWQAKAGSTAGRAAESK